MSAVVDKPTPSIRAMESADVETVVAIEANTYPFPWTSGIFRDCLRVGYFCRIIELNGRLAGYGIMSLGAGEAHILNLCIDGEFRRCGLGRTMLDYLLETARDKDISAAFLEVRPSNEDAIRLYEIAGFEKVGIRKSYYQAENGREDAVVLSLRLD